jgi:acetyl-CoA acyltransferase
MTKFMKPGRTRGWDYTDMTRESIGNALFDAGVSYTDVEQAYVGYMYGDSTAGQHAVYQFGLTGIPVVNLNSPLPRGPGYPQWPP